ncbi:MAG: hypothetical protein PHV63_03830 [Candidatus Daviesbacteria bacterium]|nr:hypothetical protein [Candidatus Daviesbacteria bacterium]
MNSGEIVKSNYDKQLTVYNRSQSFRGMGPILKDQVGIFTMWFGKQMYDNSDYETFLRNRHFYLPAPFLADFFVPDADETNNVSSLRPVAKDLAEELASWQNPLAVFIITTPRVAELGYLDRLPQGIFEYRLTPPRPTFIYKIIFGWGFSNRTYRDTDPRFREEEIIARNLEGVFFSFNGDYPTVCCRRLIEFINRILGYDLPGQEFPNYSPDEVEKIAWNIRREDFNSFSPMTGALPKYPIVNGKPQFRF